MAIENAYVEYDKTEDTHWWSQSVRLSENAAVNVVLLHSCKL